MFYVMLNLSTQQSWSLLQKIEEEIETVPEISIVCHCLYLSSVNVAFLMKTAREIRYFF